jgi:hypothetical protein
MTSLELIPLLNNSMISGKCPVRPERNIENVSKSETERLEGRNHYTSGTDDVTM